MWCCLKNLKLHAFGIAYYSVKVSRSVDNVLKHLKLKHNANSVDERLQSLLNLVPEGKVPNFFTTFQHIDMTWCMSNNVHQLGLNEILLLLNAWSRKQHGILGNSLFYGIFLEKLRKGLWKDATWDQLVQVMFFLGYSKNQGISKPLMISCLYCVNKSESLPFADYRDICVIAEALFKTSTLAPRSPFIERVTEVMINDFTQLLDHPEWMVMLIKLLRISKHYDQDLLLGMADELKKSKRTEELNLTTQTYILGLYANALLKDDQLIELLVKSALGKLQHPSWRGQSRKTHFSVGLRAKDVNTLLWALSMLCYKIDHNSITQIVLPFYTWKLERDDFSQWMELVVQTLTSLWMLEYFAYDLFNKITNLGTLEKLKEKDKNYRNLSRFAFLINCYELESGLSLDQVTVKNELSKLKLIEPSMEKDVKTRPMLMKLKQLVDDSSSVLEYVVPRLYVLGLSIYTSEKKFHIDVLDATVCFNGMSTPAGLLTAKIRLLPKVEPNTQHTLLLEETIMRLKTKDNVFHTLLHMQKELNIN